MVSLAMVGLQQTYQVGQSELLHLWHALVPVSFSQIRVTIAMSMNSIFAVEYLILHGAHKRGERERTSSMTSSSQSGMRPSIIAIRMGDHHKNTRIYPSDSATMLFLLKACALPCLPYPWILIPLEKKRNSEQAKKRASRSLPCSDKRVAPRRSTQLLWHLFDSEISGWHHGASEWTRVGLPSCLGHRWIEPGWQWARLEEYMLALNRPLACMRLALLPNIASVRGEGTGWWTWTYASHRRARNHPYTKVS